MACNRLIVPVFMPHPGRPCRGVYCNQDEITGQDMWKDSLLVRQAFQDYFITQPFSQLPETREVAF